MRAILWFPMIRLGFANPFNSLFSAERRVVARPLYGR
jgi:hypothetical protein